MKKSDLRTGMIVETRDRNRYVVLLHTGLCDYENILRNKSGWEPLSNYDDDMNHDTFSDFDIVRVWEPDLPAHVGIISKCREVYGPNTKAECIFDL